MSLGYAVAKLPLGMLALTIVGLAMGDEPGELVSPVTLRAYLEIVPREAERLSLLVDDLLAVARAERSELQLTIAPVDAADVIHEVYQALAPLARREREVVVIHETSPGMPQLLTDRQRLSQVLLNLVRNAITYTPVGGIVSIALRRAAPDHLLSRSRIPAAGSLPPTWSVYLSVFIARTHHGRRPWVASAWG